MSSWCHWLVQPRGKRGDKNGGITLTANESDVRCGTRTGRKRPAVPPTAPIPLPATPRPSFPASAGPSPQTSRDAAGFITPNKPQTHTHTQPEHPRWATPSFQPEGQGEEGGLEKPKLAGQTLELAKSWTCKLWNRMKAHADHGGHVILGDLPALDQSHACRTTPRPETPRITVCIL